MSIDTGERIADGKVATIHYTLKGDDGTVIDSSDGGQPLPYLHGASNIVPGLERALTGKALGDTFEVSIPPADAYGERKSDGPQPVPREAFPDEVELFPGMQFIAETPDGEIQPLWVDSIDGDTVFVETDHPLAGTTLHFSVQVMTIRDATAEELEHGHPHGPEGHEHS